MSKWIVRIGIMAIALGMLQGQLFADSSFSFRLQGGWAYVLGGDLNRGNNAFYSYGLGTWVPNPGSESYAVHSGQEFGGDIIFALTPRLGVGIGGGYTRIFHESYMSFSPGFPSQEVRDMTYLTKLSAFPIRAGMYLNLPWRGKFNILAELGMSYYLESRLHNESSQALYSNGIQYYHLLIVNSAENKKLPIGFNAGVSFEYEVGHDLYLFLGVQTRYARLRGWKGMGQLHEDTDPSLYMKGTLYYEVVPEVAGAPRLLLIQESPPDGPGGHPRQAVIDYSGFSLQFGTRIRL